MASDISCARVNPDVEGAIELFVLAFFMEGRFSRQRSETAPADGDGPPSARGSFAAGMTHSPRPIISKVSVHATVALAAVLWGTGKRLTVWTHQVSH